MNIVSVLKKLKEKNMITASEEGIALFSDCFNKFGVSLLLLNDEEKFDSIINLLADHNIPLQKSNGIYNFRVFAVDYRELNDIIDEYSRVDELNFLKSNPEMLPCPNNIKIILENIKRYQSEKISYKYNDEYDMSLLLATSSDISSNSNKEVDDYLKKNLKDQSLIFKVQNNIANPKELDYDLALELQKVENKICEDFLTQKDDEWKIIIDDKEVNSLKTIKETIQTLVKLNLPVTHNDALLLALFYKTSLSVSDVEEILQNDNLKGGK